MALPILSSAAASQPLPTVAALAQLWDEVTQRPLYAPPNLMRYLRLRWRMRLKLLDANKAKIAAPTAKISDCDSCTDNCCVGPSSTVLLRLRDIAMLKDIGRTDLISRDKPRFADEDVQSRPALQRHVGSNAWAVFPVMAQTNINACAALTTDGQCGIYPHWPLSCERFPYSLHSEDMEVFYSRRCDSFWIRQDAADPQKRMAWAAVAAYNERIKDLVLLEYAPGKLEDLDLTRFLSRSEPNGKLT